MKIIDLEKEQILIMAVEQYISSQQAALDALQTALEIYRDFLIDKVKEEGHVL